MKRCAIRDQDIYTNVIDYSVSKGPKPVVARVSYAELKSGQIDVNGTKSENLSNYQFESVS